MADRAQPHVVVIGAGSTGSALAHDLALRGMRVTVVERGEIASGTTGRNHCLLHSGARYCLTDPASAKECAAENLILRKILPGTMELNGGLFVAIEEAEFAKRDAFLQACVDCGIPAREISPSDALRMEPRLNSKLRAAVLVPDGVFEPYRFCNSFLASANRNGAKVLPFHPAVEVRFKGSAVAEVAVESRVAGNRRFIGCDAVINAGGPWADKIASLAGLKVPLAPTAGVMVTVAERWNRRVINRLGEPSDGDIVVPIRKTSIIGTTSWLIENADAIPIRQEDVRRMLERGDQLLPGIGARKVRGVMAAARPLIAALGVDERKLTRDFVCFDHAKDGASGFFTIIGGKTSTARLMAERTADAVCAYLGWESTCRTNETILADWRSYQPDPSHFASAGNRLRL